MPSSFWRSPSSIRATGIPVQSADDARARAVGSTASSSSRSPPAPRASLPRRRRCLLERGHAAEADLGGARQIAAPLGRAAPRPAPVSRPPRSPRERGDAGELGLPLFAHRARAAPHASSRASPAGAPLGRGVVALARERPELDPHDARAAPACRPRRGASRARGAGGCRLVQQIDGLVGQRAAGDVAARQLHRRDQPRPGCARRAAPRSARLIARSIARQSSSLGSSTTTGRKRRSNAGSFSMCWRYSSSVVAPMQDSSPRARAGLQQTGPRRASPRPAPAPTSAWISSMNSRHLVRGVAAPRAARRARGPRTRRAAWRPRPARRGPAPGCRLPCHVRRHVPGRDPAAPAPRRTAVLPDAGIADQDRAVLAAAPEDLHAAAGSPSSRPTTGSSLPADAERGQIAGVLARAAAALAPPRAAPAPPASPPLRARPRSRRAADRVPPSPGSVAPVARNASGRASRVSSGMPASRCSRPDGVVAPARAPRPARCRAGAAPLRPGTPPRRRPWGGSPSACSSRRAAALADRRPAAVSSVRPPGSSEQRRTAGARARPRPPCGGGRRLRGDHGPGARRPTGSRTSLRLLGSAPRSAGAGRRAGSRAASSSAAVRFPLVFALQHREDVDGVLRHRRGSFSHRAPPGMLDLAEVHAAPSCRARARTSRNRPGGRRGPAPAPGSPVTCDQVRSPRGVIPGAPPACRRRRHVGKVRHDRAVSTPGARRPGLPGRPGRDEGLSPWARLSSSSTVVVQIVFVVVEPLRVTPPRGVRRGHPSSRPRRASAS